MNIMPCIPHRRSDCSVLLPSSIDKVHSVHLADELVDVGFTVTEVTTLNKVLELARPPATVRVREFEGPEEVRCLHRSVSREKRILV
jgi:hypothetical protein